jgi:hypothetical protein
VSPDDRLRKLLRDHQESPVKADRGFLANLYDVLDRERRRSRARALGPGRLTSLAPVAAAAVLLVAVGATGLVLFQSPLSRTLAPAGSGVGTPLVGQITSTATSQPTQANETQATPSSRPSPGPSAPRAQTCALEWVVPPQHADAFQYLRGTGFSPYYPITWTFDTAQGERGHGLVAPDKNGSFQLETTSLTGPLGSVDSGEYRVSNGRCSATLAYP